jgi:tetratricopeptide (TPR) repeat protein
MSEPLDALEQAWRASKSPEAGATFVTALVARVKEAPTDARLRLRLGKTHFDLGDVDSAIPELQRAKVDPSARLEASYYLGYCFVKKKMAKLALNELEAAIAGATQPLDDLAKNVAYLIGRIYEQAGRKEDAVNDYRLVSPNGFDPFDPPWGGTSGSLAPLRPGDPPRRPPDPPSAKSAAGQ